MNFFCKPFCCHYYNLNNIMICIIIITFIMTNMFVGRTHAYTHNTAYTNTHYHSLHVHIINLHSCINILKPTQEKKSTSFLWQILLYLINFL